ncbi:hypothetical protein, partial [Porphyromonas gulae]
QFTHYRATEDEYEVFNPSYPKETGSNGATTTNHNTVLMRDPWNFDTAPLVHPWPYAIFVASAYDT